MLATANNVPTSDDDGFPELLKSVQDHFSLLTRGGVRHLFRTEATDLYDLFLDEIPQSMRQHYTCRCCRTFVERFGNIVSIDAETLRVSSAVWESCNVPDTFARAIRAMERAAIAAPIAGVFLSSDTVWGTPQSAPDKLGRLWSHFAILPPAQILYRTTALKNSDQAEAEVREERAMLARGLGEFSVDVVRRAHGYLTSGQLFRSEKCEAVAKWLLDLHERLPIRDRQLRDRMIWLAAAGAPAGFCHVRSGMIGTLLEDIAAGLDFATIKARFDDKMNPLKYQRPVAAPTAGNIARAEAIISELRAAGALERRFAKLSDIVPLWLPKPASAPAKAGVFGHLLKDARAEPVVDMPAMTVTWEKFQRVALVSAESIEYLTPISNQNFAALVTAKNSDAPPILQWDSTERRNPVSWYLYHGGSSSMAWNLAPSTWHTVTAVTLQPNLWHDPARFAHQGGGVLFCIAKARDTRHSTGGGFFVESLRSDFHEIRSTLEAYVKAAAIEGRDEAEACGILLQKSGEHRWSHQFRVTSKGTRTIYIIDRWD